MTNYLIDTYGMPTDAELRMPGCEGASRYVSHSTGKNVTIAQVNHIHSLGKMVQLNFEDSATNAKGGASQGAADGVFFVSVAAGQLRAPRGVAGYASVDFEATAAEITDDVCPYFSTWTPNLHAAGFLSGAYGDYNVGVALLKARLIDLFWQTVAWSDGKRVIGAVLLQDTFTSGYDKDELLQSFIGAWTPTGPQKPPTPTPAPKPTPTPVQEDMTMLVRFHDALKGATAVFGTNFETLTPLTLADYDGLGRPPVHVLSCKDSNLYKLPVTAGLIDPRK